MWYSILWLFRPISGSQSITKEVAVDIHYIYRVSPKWWYKRSDDDSTSKNKSKKKNNIFSFGSWFSRKMSFKEPSAKRVLIVSFEVFDFSFCSCWYNVTICFRLLLLSYFHTVRVWNGFINEDKTVIFSKSVY